MGNSRSRIDRVRAVMPGGPDFFESKDRRLARAQGIIHEASCADHASGDDCEWPCDRADNPTGNSTGGDAAPTCVDGTTRREVEMDVLCASLLLRGHERFGVDERKKWSAVFGGEAGLDRAWEAVRESPLAHCFPKRRGASDRDRARTWILLRLGAVAPSTGNNNPAARFYKTNRKLGEIVKMCVYYVVYLVLQNTPFGETFGHVLSQIWDGIAASLTVKDMVRSRVAALRRTCAPAAPGSFECGLLKVLGGYEDERFDTIASVYRLMAAAVVAAVAAHPNPRVLLPHAATTAGIFGSWQAIPLGVAALGLTGPAAVAVGAATNTVLGSLVWPRVYQILARATVSPSSIVIPGAVDGILESEKPHAYAGVLHRDYWLRRLGCAEKKEEAQPLAGGGRLSKGEKWVRGVRNPPRTPTRRFDPMSPKGRTHCEAISQSGSKYKCSEAYASRSISGSEDDQLGATLWVCRCDLAQRSRRLADHGPNDYAVTSARLWACDTALPIARRYRDVLTRRLAAMRGNSSNSNSNPDDGAWSVVGKGKKRGGRANTPPEIGEVEAELREVEAFGRDVTEFLRRLGVRGCQEIQSFGRRLTYDDAQPRSLPRRRPPHPPRTATGPPQARRSR